MGKETEQKETVFSKDIKGKVKDWGQMSYLLPDGIPTRNQKFLKAYFRAQVRLIEGSKNKAAKILEGLGKRDGFNKFEEEEDGLFASIDIAVRGQTNRKIDPVFRKRD